MTRQTIVVPSNWREILSEKDRLSLSDDGFLHIRGVFGGAGLDAMREAWVRRSKAPEPAGQKKQNNYGPYNLEVEPAFLPCLEHPYVMSAVAQLLGGDVVLGAFRGRDPRAGSGQQGFHADFASPVPPDGQCLANAFWILDDMDESNGATRVIPGTHRIGRLPPKGWTRREARHPEQRSINARAGDVLVFSAHLWHAGSENRSGASRRLAMAHFCRKALVRFYQNA